MSTLVELEKAVESLSPEDKQRLMVFLAARLRAENPRMPSPRKFSREEMEAWVKEDEEDARALECARRQSRPSGDRTPSGVQRW